MRTKAAPRIEYLPGTDIPKMPGLDYAIRVLNDWAQASGKGVADDALCLAGDHWWTRVRWWVPDDPNPVDHWEPCPQHRRRWI